MRPRAVAQLGRVKGPVTYRSRLPLADSEWVTSPKGAAYWAGAPRITRTLALACWACDVPKHAEMKGSVPSIVLLLRAALGCPADGQESAAR